MRLPAPLRDYLRNQAVEIALLAAALACGVVGFGYMALGFPAPHQLGPFLAVLIVVGALAGFPVWLSLRRL